MLCSQTDRVFYKAAIQAVYLSSRLNYAKTNAPLNFISQSELTGDFFQDLNINILARLMP